MIKIDVHATHAVVRKQKPLTVGLVGAKVRFSFGEDWDGLVKTAVFRQGDVTVDAVNVSGESIIPWEVLTQPGLPVQIGICGINSDGTVVIPTLWAETEPVQPGADPSGDASAAAALPVYQQILAQIGPLDQLDTEAKDNLVASINEANRAVYLVTVVQNEDGTYSADKSIEELSAAEDAGKVLLCYLRDVRVLTGLTGGNRGSTYVFTAVIGNTEHRVVMRENGVFCDYSTLATEQSRLPNPEKLTFEGAVSATYDGSSPVVVNIPKGGSGVHVGSEPPADPSVNVWIDPEGGDGDLDLTIPDALPNPEKLTFTGIQAEYDGSAPVSVTIPTKTSDLKNDSGYVTSVPGALPNPEKLTFTGAVTGEYDGSQAVTVALPKTMVVTLTHSNGVYTADTTYAEISEAYEAGQEVRCNYQDMLLPLVQYSSFFVVFACVYGTKLYSVLIKATDNSVTMTVTDASASGDADLSGYIPAPETAAVGQTVAVKAVDENGKPTQWEAVDLASGGAGGGNSFIGDWGDPIVTVVTEEEVQSIVITEASDYKECLVLFIPAVSSTATDRFMPGTAWIGQAFGGGEHFDFSTAHTDSTIFPSKWYGGVNVELGLRVVEAIVDNVRTEKYYNTHESSLGPIGFTVPDGHFFGIGTTIKVWAR